MKRIFTYLGDEWNQWDSANGLKVWYKPVLDGGGSFVADWFIAFMQRRFPSRRFQNAFEWCAGPGFIGFSLLEAGICDQLTLADINPQAIECIEKTISTADHLRNVVSFYISDNLHQIPSDQRFDLVVSNPPFARNGSESHFHDIRTEDPGWRVHADFFSNIRKHLSPGAVMCLGEFCPLESKPEHDLLPTEFAQWDNRERPPIEEMLPLIRNGGLQLKEVVHATGATPLIRISSQAPTTTIDYIDWFWILVIQVDERRKFFHNENRLQILSQ